VNCDAFRGLDGIEGAEETAGKDDRRVRVSAVRLLQLMASAAHESVGMPSERLARIDKAMQGMGLGFPR